MKLYKFKIKKNKTKYVLISSLSILGIGSVFILGNAFGKYQATQSYSVINGQLHSSNKDNPIIAVNVDGVSQKEIPAKDTGIYFESAECENGATGSWDTTQKTKCTPMLLT